MGRATPDKPADRASRRMLVIMPTLLGESVMATAALHALREVYPDTHITALIKRKLRPVLYGLPSVDRVIAIRKRLPEGLPRRKRRGRASMVGLGRRLSRGGFDTAVILPGSFKYAALAAVAGIPRRVGYESDGRAVLLTDRLVPHRRRGVSEPVPPLDAYLGIARYLGAADPGHQMHQGLHPDAQARLIDRLADVGVDPCASDLLLVNPGAPTPARRWSPRRMAHLCELMAERYGVTPVVTGTPGEREEVDRLLERSTVPIVDLPELGTDLRLLKAMVARCRMMVTNDTGPRHLAAAMGVPLLTLFGPTAPQWSEIGFAYEEQVVADGLSVSARDDPSFRGPASLDRLHTDQVFDRACRLWERTRHLTTGGDASHG